IAVDQRTEHTVVVRRDAQVTVDVAGAQLHPQILGDLGVEVRSHAGAVQFVERDDSLLVLQVAGDEVGRAVAATRDARAELPPETVRERGGRRILDHVEKRSGILGTRAGRSLIVAAEAPSEVVRGANVYRTVGIE